MSAGPLCLQSGKVLVQWRRLAWLAGSLVAWLAGYKKGKCQHGRQHKHNTRQSSFVCRYDLLIHMQIFYFYFCCSQDIFLSTSSPCPIYWCGGHGVLAYDIYDKILCFLSSIHLFSFWVLGLFFGSNASKWTSERSVFWVVDVAVVAHMNSKSENVLMFTLKSCFIVRFGPLWGCSFYVFCFINIF